MVVNGHCGKASLAVNSPQNSHIHTCPYHGATKIAADYAMTKLRLTKPCQHNTGRHTAQETTVKNTCKVDVTAGWEEV